jgi:hypothetical protein
MKIGSTISADLAVKLAIGAAIVGGAVYLLYRLKGAADAVGNAISDTAGTIADTVSNAASATVTAVNPTSSDNLANRAAVSIYQTVTGSTGTMGSDLYDWLHPNG